MTTSDDSREFVQAAEKELKVLKDESGYFSLIGKIASKLEKAASHQHLADALEDFEQFKQFHGGNKGFSSVIRLWNVLHKLLLHVEENEKKLVETCMERLVALEQMISSETDKDLRNLLKFVIKRPDSGIINWDKVKELAIKIQEQVAGIRDIEQTLMRILRKEEVKAASHITPQHYNWGGSWEDIMSTLQKILSSYSDANSTMAYVSIVNAIYREYVQREMTKFQPKVGPFWLFYALAFPKVIADENIPELERSFEVDAQRIRTGLTMETLRSLELASKALAYPNYDSGFHANGGKVHFEEGKDEPIVYELMYKSIRYSLFRADKQFEKQVTESFMVFHKYLEQNFAVQTHAIGGTRVINAIDPNFESHSGMMLRYSLMQYFRNYLPIGTNIQYFSEEILPYLEMLPRQ